MPNVLTLPDTVQACIYNNLRLQAGAQKMEQAWGDYWTATLIPNSELFTDYQLIPLQHADVINQVGPPQFDALLTIPLDWWVYGKRVANMEATRLGIDVATATYADQIRQRVTETVVAFYDLLEAKELARLAHEDLDDLDRIAGMVRKKVEQGAAGAVENDRMRLLVIDSRRELRKREATVESARAKLRPLIGRGQACESIDITGTLEIRAVPPAIPVHEAICVAERNRPDLFSDQRLVAQAEASVERERRKGYPTLSVTPGYTYQNQHRITGFRNASMFDIGLTTSLPLTDRNQGNIARARSGLREQQLNLEADLAQVRAEVEQAVVEFNNAVTTVTTDVPAMLDASKSIRDRIEAAYKTGGESLAELVGAQQAFRERIRTKTSSYADYWRALHRLQGAVGTSQMSPEAPRPR